MSNKKESPREISMQIIAVLPKRTQDIIRKRFGLDNDQFRTLYSVGTDYKVTRERIRQIIEAALKTVRKQPIDQMAGVFIKQAEKVLEESGGVCEDKRFLTDLEKRFAASQGNLSAIRFLLALNPAFVLEEENNSRNSFWRLAKISKEKIQKNIKAVEKLFEKKDSTFLLDEIWSMIKGQIPGGSKKEELRSYLEISKKIGMNPFGEYGLFAWMEIDPSGARDRAYLIMKHSQKPLHFSEITQSLNEYNKTEIPVSVASHSWQKKVCVQTVHNELIRDPRFVLIGRGIYALGEWGYQPGKIVNVIVGILQKAGHPLSQEKIIQEVQKRRLAKENTIILNLHNKKYFKKLPNKYYALAKPASGRSDKKGPYKILEV